MKALWAVRPKPKSDQLPGRLKDRRKAMLKSLSKSVGFMQNNEKLATYTEMASMLPDKVEGDSSNTACMRRKVQQNFVEDYIHHLGAGSSSGTTETSSGPAGLTSNEPESLELKLLQ